ncbi:hypothetical protein AB0L13_33765 [Saccharopolyspora shandongensis]
MHLADGQLRGLGGLERTSPIITTSPVLFAFRFPTHSLRLAAFLGTIVA